MISRCSAFIILFSFLSFCSRGQDWKTSYDQAIQSYQKQDYVLALVAAEIAFSKTMEPRNKAYALQLITAACLGSDQPKKGLTVIDEEIKLFYELEGSDSKKYIEALKKQISLLEMNQQLKPALEKANELIPIINRVYGSTHYEFGMALLQQGNLMVSLNDYKNAKASVNLSTKILKPNPEAIENYYSALFLAAIVDRKLNELQDSEKKLKEYIKWSEENGFQKTSEYNQAKSILIEIAFAKGDLESKDIPAHQKVSYYLKLAQGYQQELKLDSALKYYTKCEKVITDASLENNTAFSNFISYANALIQNKNLYEAESKINKARGMANKLFIENSKELSYLYEAEANLLLAYGQTQQAEEKYLLAADLLKISPSQTHAKLLRSIAQKLSNANRLQSALKVIEPLALNTVTMETLSEQEQVDVSVLYTSLLPYEKSESAITFLKSKIENMKSLQAKITLQVQLSTLWIKSGEWRLALNLLSEVLKDQSLNTKLCGDAAYQLGKLNQWLGHYNEAEKNYTLAIKSYQINRTTCHYELFLSYNSLATFYITLGNYEAAENLYNELIEQTDVNSDFYSVLRQNLAVIFEQTLRYEEAKKILEETLQRDKQILGTSNSDYAITLQNLAVLYKKTGMLVKAKALLLKAVEIDKNNSGEQSLIYASKLANLGTIYQELGELDKAKESFENALNIRENKLGKDHPYYIFNQYNLAVLYQIQKEYALAYPLFKTVSNFYLNQINELFPSLSELEKTAFCNKINEIINAYQDFAIEYYQTKKDIAGDLYNFRLATKALLLNASTKIRNRIINSGDEDLLSRFNEWQHIKQELAKLYTLELAEKNKQQQNIQRLQLKSNELEKFLSSQSELFATHNDNKNITWQNIKEALKPNEAAIEMIRLKMNQKNDSIIYAALIIRYDQPNPLLIVLPNGRQLEGREFINYKNSIQFQIENPRPYTLFWLPFNEALSGINTIYFSPDGVFNKINLSTLFDSQKSEYLIERFNILLVSNTRELLNKPIKLPTVSQATLIGFPNYNLEAITKSSAQGTRAMSEVLESRLPELPGTQEELLKINDILLKHHWQTKLFMREQASEENVKALHSPTVLHIATHGFFKESINDNSPIIFSKDLSKIENNPLLRSGILLAGAESNQFNNKPESEDGILTALEAMNLNLDNTDLVVLSACETGSGQIRNGEGVFGLQRSFLVSGANSIMMSLWKVNDNATQELMVEFYKYWLESNNKADAFRKTQLSLKKKYTAPYYWGAFIMMGK